MFTIVDTVITVAMKQPKCGSFRDKILVMKLVDIGCFTDKQNIVNKIN